MSLPDLATIANITTASTLLVALVFGILQVRSTRHERDERVAVEIVHAMQTPAYIASARILNALHDDTTPDELSKCGGQEAALTLGMTFETLGYLVYRRLVPLEVADDLVGGIVRVSWRKLHLSAQADRDANNAQAYWEWWEWLADRLRENARPEKTVGAHRAYANWRP